MRTLVILCLALAACAPPKPSLPVRASDPPLVRGSGEHRVHVLPVDGRDLFTQAWRPTQAPPRGVLIVQHGLRDYGDHYAALAEVLLARGIAVYAMDFPGHGRSSGPRVTVASFDEFVGALDAFVGYVRAQEPGLPIVLLGHSMGAATAGLWAEQHPGGVDGLILSAAALWVDRAPIAAPLLHLIAGLSPNKPMGADNEGFSSDPAFKASMDADPLIFQPGGPARTASELLHAIHRFWANLDALDTPLLLLHGTADVLTSPAGARAIYARTHVTNKTLRLYQGLAHDLIHEPAPGGTQVITDIANWTEARITNTTASFPPADLTTPLAGETPGPLARIDLTLADRVATDPRQHDIRGGLRVRAMRGTRAGLAFGLDLDAGYADGLVGRATIFPLGVGIAGGGHQAQLGLGVGVAGQPGDRAFLEVPAHLDLRLALGSIRFAAHARATWTRAGAFDAVPWEAGLGLRLGRERPYWPGVAAGLGPTLTMLVGGVAGADAVTFVGAALGFELSGGR